MEELMNQIQEAVEYLINGGGARVDTKAGAKVYWVGSMIRIDVDPDTIRNLD